MILAIAQELDIIVPILQMGSLSEPLGNSVEITTKSKVIVRIPGESIFVSVIKRLDFNPSSSSY